MPGELAPAIGGDLAVTRVETDDDVASESGAGVLQEARVLDCRGADDHVAQPAVDVFLDGVQVADAAAELHRNLVADGLEDRLDRRVVLGLAGKRAVQIHQVQATRALLHPLERHRGRVFAEDGGLFHVALLEANAVAVFEINRGNQDHVSWA